MKIKQNIEHVGNTRTDAEKMSANQENNFYKVFLDKLQYELSIVITKSEDFSRDKKLNSFMDASLINGTVTSAFLNTAKELGIKANRPTFNTSFLEKLKNDLANLTPIEFVKKILALREELVVPE